MLRPCLVICQGRLGLNFQQIMIEKRLVEVDYGVKGVSGEPPGGACYVPRLLSYLPCANPLESPKQPSTNYTA